MKRRAPRPLLIDGKAARVIGTVPGYVVVRIGAARPICLTNAEYDLKEQGAP